jgi:opacity protein-like surface antigen
MSWLKVLTAAGLLAAQVTTTMAADMPGSYSRDPLPIPERMRPQSFDANLGWYLRGDLGYHWGIIDGAQSSSGLNPTDSKLDKGMDGGIGFGIKRDWMRTDVTVDYFSPLKYQGTIAAPGDVTAKMSAWSALFNGYLDLGTWYRMIPYVGAGAGVARVKTSDYENAVFPPVVGGASNNQWNFAWAGMAGVGFVVSNNVVIDAGYRYINFGDVKTATDATGTMTFKNIAAHEVRVGFRWSFDDLPVSH